MIWEVIKPFLIVRVLGSLPAPRNIVLKYMKQTEHRVVQFTKPTIIIYGKEASFSGQLMIDSLFKGETLRI